MAENKVQFLISAKDEASQVIEWVEKNVDSLWNSVEKNQKTIGERAKSNEAAFQKMAVVGGIVAWIGIAIAKTSFDAYSDAQAEMAIVNQSLSNSLVGLNEKQLKTATWFWTIAEALTWSVIPAMDAASQSALQLWFDDEAAAVAFSKLFAVTKDTWQAMQEMSIAMDLARYKNISLEEASQKLLMVHAGTTRELKALGIAVDENATITQNLASIQQQVAGSAAVYGESAKGASDKINVAMWNLKETIGEWAPAMAKLAEAILPIITWITNRAAENPKLVSTIIIWVTAMWWLIATLGTLWLVLPSIIAWVGAVWTAMTVLAWPIWILVVWIAFLAYTIYKNRDIIVEATQWFSTKMQKIRVDLKVFLVERFLVITWFISDSRNSIYTTATTMRNNISSMISWVVNWIVSFISWSRDAITWAFSNMLGGISGVAKSILNGAIGIIEGFVNSAVASLNSLISLANSVPWVSIENIAPVSFGRLAKGGIAWTWFFGDAGGVVTGANGIDKVPTMLTAGELVLNRAQQWSIAGQLQNQTQKAPTIVIQWNNFYWTDREFIDKIGETIMQEFKLHAGFASF